MKWKKVVSFLAVFLVILAAAYVAGMAFFASHYTYGTYIGKKDFSFKSKNSVYSEYPNEKPDFIVQLNGRGDVSLDIDSKAIISSIDYDLGNLERYNGNILNGLGWINKNLHSNVIDVTAHVTVDEDVLKDIINSSDMNDRSKLKEPQNAFLGEYNSKTKQFEILQGDLGNILETKNTVSAVKEALNNIPAGIDRIIVNLDEKDCYKHPLMSVDNAKLVKERDRANSILNTKITYDWYGNWDVIDSYVIKDWIKVKDNTVSIDEAKVRQYVERSAGYYDTYNKELRFRTHSGDIKNIKRGDYGWLTDVDTEVEELMACLEKGGEQIKEPVHLHEAYAKGSDDIGGSYVEIDLSNQHLYLYKDGKLFLDTDLVSGNVSAGHKTPDGIYGVTYKAQSVVLRGPGYASFVYYWMPYKGGVGMHDATWRNKFGGTIYKSAGSHGCINLPLSVAKQIYEQVEAGFPVVSYW